MMGLNVTVLQAASAQQHVELLRRLPLRHTRLPRPIDASGVGSPARSRRRLPTGWIDACSLRVRPQTRSQTQRAHRVGAG